MRMTTTVARRPAAAGTVTLAPMGFLFVLTISLASWGCGPSRPVAANPPEPAGSTATSTLPAAGVVADTRKCITQKTGAKFRIEVMSFFNSAWGGDGKAVDIDPTMFANIRTAARCRLDANPNVQVVDDLTRIDDLMVHFAIEDEMKDTTGSHVVLVLWPSIVTRAEPPLAAQGGARSRRTVQVPATHADWGPALAKAAEEMADEFVATLPRPQPWELR